MVPEAVPTAITGVTMDVPAASASFKPAVQCKVKPQAGLKQLMGSEILIVNLNPNLIKDIMMGAERQAQS